jgi:hypothetical protein
VVNERLIKGIKIWMHPFRAAETSRVSVVAQQNAESLNLRCRLDIIRQPLTNNIMRSKCYQISHYSIFTKHSQKNLQEDNDQD